MYGTFSLCCCWGEGTFIILGPDLGELTYCMGDAVVFSVDVPPFHAIGGATDLPIGCVAEIECEAPRFVTTMEGDAEEGFFGYNAPVAFANMVLPNHTPNVVEGQLVLFVDLLKILILHPSLQMLAKVSLALQFSQHQPCPME